MKKFYNLLFSPVLMGILLLVLGVALAVATFIENDFGAEFARMKVYNTRWLEVLFLLLAINMTGRIFRLKLYKPKKFTIFLFHFAFIGMIAGAAITRYFGYEGTMHIREGQASSTIITGGMVLKVQTDDNNPVTFNTREKLSADGSFNESVDLAGKPLHITLTKRYKNAYEKAAETENGVPIIGFILSGPDIRGFQYLEKNTPVQLGKLNFSFGEKDHADIAFSYDHDTLYIDADSPISVSEMGNKAEVYITNSKVPFEAKKLYKIKQYSLVFQEFYQSAKVVPVESTVQNHMLGMQAMEFRLQYGETAKNVILWDKNWNTAYVKSNIEGHNVNLFYGNNTIDLPFSVYLKDFAIDRYPGSMSPSSFSSYVTLRDNGNAPIDFHIYMNNILKYEGFRFYQSSYDDDERGTILSVNSDRWGTTVTYFSYAVLFLGMIFSLLNKNSFFRKTKLNEKLLAVTAFIFISFTSSAQMQGGKMPDSHRPIDKKHAEKFGELLIQNTKGRTEPVYTFASELMRKISRKENIMGMNPVQLFMEMNMQPSHWTQAPLIRVTNGELQQLLGMNGKYTSYSSFIDPQKGYVLRPLVQKSFEKSPGERTKLDKAIIKTDEKVNICYAIFSGRYLKMFPVPNSRDSVSWFVAEEAAQKATNQEDSLFLSRILKTYYDEVLNAKTTGDYSLANEMVSGINTFQRTHAGYSLPSDFKISVEIMYYKLNPFKILFPFYATFGVLYLFLLIAFIVSGKQVPRIIRSSFFYVLLLAFVVHVIAIAARWYISGHAPMSNGYESMIFISGVTLLAGFIFNKLSSFALPATAVLGGLTLMVANLSFMDPVITNLVPVLQSYWLTIHVSVITASYGFLGLGAILGLINMILMTLRTSKNQERILNNLQSLTILNHKTLIVGLYLLTIGTFLGAVWANESWGRYWGWDPKETWAFISILVYTIVTHARLIPGLKGIFTFNALSVYGFASILMTYFGVNYYLSGLHSYAAGDPVPVPNFVYYTVAAVLLLTVASAYQFDKMQQSRK
ncbi:c-type cytochrome biogenesis protein CcsB [Saccharicrinis sp. FJH54]|uniref:c-type cytochrome biogenesis protein CcsB n=1 Tax=Saccharicrinis sp. FJH54 TaxID=3344665 RepID=UPI0035D49B78